MDAILHSETQTHRRLFGAAKSGAAHSNPAAAETRGLIPPNVKRIAMSAIANVETVAQVGTMKLVGGIALYTARIREADRENQRDEALRKWNKAHEKRSHDLGRE